MGLIHNTNYMVHQLPHATPPATQYDEILAMEQEQENRTATAINPKPLVYYHQTQSTTPSHDLLCKNPIYISFHICLCFSHVSFSCIFSCYLWFSFFEGGPGKLARFYLLWSCQMCHTFGIGISCWYWFLWKM